MQVRKEHYRMSYLEGNDFNEQNMVSVPNPYVYQTLQSVIGKHVVIETVRGNVRGKLKDGNQIICSLKIRHHILYAFNKLYGLC